MFSNNFKNKIQQINQTNDDLIDISLIDFDAQYRQDKDGYDLEGLAKNIYELSKSSKTLPVGLKQRPTLTKQSNGRYLVDDGEMRVRAFKLLNRKYPDDPRWKKIPYNESLENIDNRNERDLSQLSANLFRDSGTIFDIAFTITKLVNNIGVKRVTEVLKQRDIAASKTAISRYKKVANAPEQLKDDIKSIDVKDFSTVAVLIDLFKLDINTYNSLITAYSEDKLNGSLYKEASRVLSDIKSKSKQAAQEQSQAATQTEKQAEVNSNFDNDSNTPPDLEKIKQTNTQKMIDFLINEKSVDLENLIDTHKSTDPNFNISADEILKVKNGEMDVSNELNAFLIGRAVEHGYQSNNQEKTDIKVASKIQLTRDLLTVIVDGKTLKFAITSNSIVNAGG